MSAWDYLQIEMIPLLTLLIVLILSVGRFVTYHSSKRFQVLVVLVMSILMVDGINWYMLLEPGKYSMASLWFFNIVYFLLTEAIAYCWFLYVYYQIHRNVLTGEQKKWIPISLIPLVIICVIILFSPWNHMVFYFDSVDLSYHRGNFHLLQAGCGFGYMIVASILAFFQSREAKLREERQECQFLCSIALVPFIGGALQIINYDLVFLWPFTAAAVFLIYCDYQKHCISVDALTSLSNRGSLERYLQERTQRRDTGWYLLMIDADKFKEINDKYGHVEGDEALKIIAEALKNVFGITTAFIARYGGDEFVVITEADSDKVIQEAIKRCEEELSREGKVRALPYELKISTGYARYVDPETTPVEQMLKRADGKMYERKRKY